MLWALPSRQFAALKGFSGSNVMRLVFHFLCSFIRATGRWECARVYHWPGSPLAAPVLRGASATCPLQDGPEEVDTGEDWSSPVAGLHSCLDLSCRTPSGNRLLGQPPTGPLHHGFHANCSLPISFLFASLWLQPHCSLRNIWYSFCFEIFFFSLKYIWGTINTWEI